MKRNYWKETCLLLIGVFIGLGFDYCNKPKEFKKVITIERDTIVDTFYVQKTIPLNKENVLAELKKQNIPHPHIVLAQSRLETGNYTSKVCRIKNNLFGMKKGNTYRNYNNWKESIEDYKRHISSKYKGGDYYKFLENLGYAEDTLYTTLLKRIV